MWKKSTACDTFVLGNVGCQQTDSQKRWGIEMMTFFFVSAHPHKTINVYTEKPIKTKLPIFSAALLNHHTGNDWSKLIINEVHGSGV